MQWQKPASVPSLEVSTLQAGECTIVQNQVLLPPLLLVCKAILLQTLLMQLYIERSKALIFFDSANDSNLLEADLEGDKTCVDFSNCMYSIPYLYDSRVSQRWRLMLSRRTRL